MSISRHAFVKHPRGLACTVCGCSEGHGIHDVPKTRMAAIPGRPGLYREVVVWTKHIDGVWSRPVEGGDGRWTVHRRSIGDFVLLRGPDHVTFESAFGHTTASPRKAKVFATTSRRDA